MHQFEDIRKHYEEKTPRIMQSGDRWISPHSHYVDWNKIFSPIEWDTWMALRSYARIPLYPQYPVGRFFADFGNPYYKIALECDGKAYHQDKEKDARRDDFFINEGWSVYRCPGSHCYKIVDYTVVEPEEFIQTMRDYYRTVEGLIKALASYYCGDRTFYNFEVRLIHECLDFYGSKKHDVKIFPTNEPDAFDLYY
jgi:very-short-patch-repair endonuclease